MPKGAILIDGRYHANRLLETLKKDIDYQKRENNLTPKLAIILVGSDPASTIYVRNKINAAKKIGIDTILCNLDKTVPEKVLLNEIERMNEDKSVSGIIVQLPLPDHISKEKVINAIDPKKDVDGFHPLNVGLLTSGYSTGFIPCTARGVLELIKMTEQNIAGKKVVIIGRSNIVGKPLASLLLQFDATVTLCHSKTKNLAFITSTADIVISAVGKPRFLTAEYFSEKAIVIDVGINRLTFDDAYELAGDVDFESVRKKVSYITPVPGGVGPMTISYLLINSFEAMMKLEGEKNMHKQ
jgi:methylenetetrahydrofolate dehydrogenase (NADP+)/methenyltetrahydrofolate cyclohydrolase